MRKKSAVKAAKEFQSNSKEIEEFLEDCDLGSLSEEHTSWVYDYAIIRLYRGFEDLILECLVAAINNDTSHLSARTGIRFPKHLTDEVCEYLIVGDGYFDFKGRDGLIKTMKQFLTEDHYLVQIAKKPVYKESLERLSALRNFAAHGSSASKVAARTSIAAERLSSSGSWLKRKERFAGLADQLRKLASEIVTEAPY